MIVFCTYCSAAKSRAPALLPAIDRYLSKRVRAVFRASATLGVAFRILSGEYGLVRPDEPLPWYDRRLTADDVDRLAEVVRRQLEESGAGHLVYFTRTLAEDADAAPYRAVVEKAAASAGVPLSVLELPPKA